MIDSYIKTLLHKAIQDGYVDEMDTIFLTNRLLHLLQKEMFDVHAPINEQLSYQELLDFFLKYALDRGIIEDVLSLKEQFEADVMAILTPSPSVLNQRFWDKYQQSKEEATNYFYQLSQDNDYIKTRAIAKNISFKHNTEYGSLDITINLSKPEKDPKDIAKAKQQTEVSYPTSQLTMTNEGYYGRSDHPARSNHRIIRFDVNADGWGFQYSPYAYFNEHCIFLSQEVRPMVINSRSFSNLLHIVEKFPHYFVGSNADLPIVGGSILSHDHYQAGCHVFPMELAEETAQTTICNVSASLLHWPLSVIRLRDKSIATLVKAAEHLLKVWQHYTDETVDILSHTQDIPHNTVTPIARYKNEQYELDIVLRNNRTSVEHPDGIFHPHQDVQHIKKENIGLIEVMGLAILPPRLKQEMQEVQDYLDGKVHKVNPIHQEWAEHLKANGLSVEHGIGETFKRVLEDAGVFKQDELGQAAFGRFMEKVKQAEDENI